MSDTIAINGEGICLVMNVREVTSVLTDVPLGGPNRRPIHFEADTKRSAVQRPCSPTQIASPLLMFLAYAGDFATGQTVEECSARERLRRYGS